MLIKEDEAEYRKGVATEAVAAGMGFMKCRTAAAAAPCLAPYQWMPTRESQSTGQLYHPHAHDAVGRKWP